MLGTAHENGGGTRDEERTYAAAEEPDWPDIAKVIDSVRGSESTGGLMWHDPSGRALPPRGTPVLVVWPGLVTGRAFKACGWLIGPAAEHALSRRPQHRSHVPRPSAESMHGIAGRDELGVRALGVLDLIVERSANGAASGLAGSTIAVPSGGDRHRCPTPAERAALDAAVTFTALDTNEIDAAVVHPRVRVLGEMTRMWVVPLVNRSVTIVRGSLHSDYRWATPTVPYSDAEERTVHRIETTAGRTRSVDLNQCLLSAVYRQVAEGETGGRVAAAVGHLRRAWSNRDGVDHSERIVALCAGFEALLGEPPSASSRKRWMAEQLDALFATAREAGGRPHGCSHLIWDQPARGDSHLEDFCGGAATGAQQRHARAEHALRGAPQD